MDPEEYRKNIENKILAIMKQRLESGQMTAERSKEIAKFVLQVLLPGMSIAEIHAGLAKISQQYIEFSQLAIATKNNLEEEKKTTTLVQVHELIQQGNVDAANDLLKKVSQPDSSTPIQKI